MDFKSLISKIESIDGPIETPKAPELAAPIRLDEDTELRVLAGVTKLTESIIAEKAVSKSQQKFMGMVHAAHQGEPAASPEVAKAAKGMSKKDAEDFASTKHKGLPDKVSEADERKPAKKSEREVELPSGAKVKATKVQGWQSQKADKEADSKKDESIDKAAFKEKFTKMVEAKKDKMKKKSEKMDEGSDPSSDEGAKPDFLDIDKDGNKKEPMKSAAKGKGKSDGKDKDDSKGSKGLSAKQKKLPPGLQKAIQKKSTAESTTKSKKVVAESVEQKLSLKEMLKVVKESGGQQAIDPMDKELWTWANRVASSKVLESQKAEIFAAMIYERNGGRFEMYDVLSESKKTLSESYQLDEGIIDMVKDKLLPKVMNLFGADAEKIANTVKQAADGNMTLSMDNGLKVAQALGLDTAAKDQLAKKEPKTEAWGIAGNWQGKLIQLGYTILVGGGLFAGWTGAGGPWLGRFVAVLGIVLLAFADTFFSTDKGMVGAMGKNGNKGSDTDKGPRSGVDLSRGDAGTLD